ncbi:universal stress protein TB31.7 [soil metagenome]
MTDSAAPQGIFAAVDGSPAAKVAVDWAARDAALRGVPLTLVHVLPTADMQAWLEVPTPEFFSQLVRDQGREVLREALKVAQEATADNPIVVHQLTCEGHAVPTLIEVAEHAQLLVVGRRGLGRVGRLFLGSVSSGLLHHAHCPVAVIHDEDPLMSLPYQAPVVVGIDGSSASELATAIAFDEASRRGVGVVAVHAWSDPAVYLFPSEEWMNFQPQAERMLSERLAPWEDRYPAVPVQRVAVQDRPARILLEHADSAQLVVVGSHGRGGFAGMLLGSVGSAVAQSARMPVIVARPA